MGPVVAGVLDVVGGSGRGALVFAVENSGRQQSNYCQVTLINTYIEYICCNSLKNSTSLRLISPESIRNNTLLVIISIGPPGIEALFRPLVGVRGTEILTTVLVAKVVCCIFNCSSKLSPTPKAVTVG